LKTRRSKACDIPQAVKIRVWERDGGKCVVCDNDYNVMPNGHYVSRSKGGLGIEQNVVTLCTDLTPNKCHSRYDGLEHETIGPKIKAYLMKKYPGWDEEKLYYRKCDQ
jgi:5-methylcytosine-specific restriction endonuclease McrA